MNPSNHNRLTAFLGLLRATQWVKNVFVFAPLFFAGRILDAEAWRAAALACAGFCLLSSATYIVNDIADVEEDRAHPRKRRRPIAVGEVSPFQGMLVALACAAVGTVLCLSVSVPVTVIGLAYVCLNCVYTFWLKHHVLVDVMCIAVGFVLRALAGGLAVGVPVSLWLHACTFTLCTFLGFGKRRCEVAELGGSGLAAEHSAKFARYTLPLLDQLLSVSAGVTIVTYILYTVDSDTVARTGTPYLFFSVPLVIYCVFRFAMLVEAGRISDPTEAITRDWPFMAALAIWAAYAGAVVMWGAEVRAYLESAVGPLLKT
ncbi:MAG: decaprenyl-phosphate phosphoribosyltransferase [Planctomycetota bacterium]